MQKQCPQCGATFTCEPQGHCWCSELPRLPLPPDLRSTSCLCRKCLLEKIKAAEASRPTGHQSHPTDPSS
ncbi:MAG TPA: cysteine-rich CWC family protein [Verrucomicrobiae bacterium]|nr:cysteine-rich CWC family protein [Verrucomicrobiae bacterium]